VDTIISLSLPTSFCITRKTVCWCYRLYADDIVLLTPSANAMRVMLSECDRFGCQYSVRFNATKSKSMLFVAKGRANKRHTSRPDFMLMGKV